MQFVNATERMPTDTHRSYWCRITLKPLEPRRKNQQQHTDSLGFAMGKDEIKQRNSEVMCMSLRVYHQAHDSVINGQTVQPAGYYFAAETLNMAYFAKTIEWLEGDGATPTDEQFDPPHSYKMEKLREMEDRAAAEGRTLPPY